jgi:hypothetical protein
VRFAQLNGSVNVGHPVTALASPVGPALAANPDGLMGTLAPVWQVAIGGCVVLVVIAASARLARRGPSRMTTALLVTGVAIVGLTVIGILSG